MQRLGGLVRHVYKAPPAYLSLRDKDRYLWGFSRAEQLKRDIQSGFER